MSRKIYIIIAMVFTVVLSVSTFFIIRNHIDSAKQSEVYDNLAEIVEDEPPKENEGVTFSEDKDYLIRPILLMAVHMCRKIVMCRNLQITSLFTDTT